MACETYNRRNVSRAQRALDIRASKTRFNEGLISGKVKPVIDKKTGAIAFTGITNEQRDDVSDACVYRHVMSNGSQLAKLAIMKAEQEAGRKVDAGTAVHSHDGGKTWGSH